MNKFVKIASILMLIFVMLAVVTTITQVSTTTELPDGYQVSGVDFEKESVIVDCVFFRGNATDKVVFPDGKIGELFVGTVDKCFQVSNHSAMKMNQVGTNEELYVLIVGNNWSSAYRDPVWIITLWDSEEWDEIRWEATRSFHIKEGQTVVLLDGTELTFVGFKPTEELLDNYIAVFRTS